MPTGSMPAGAMFATENPVLFLVSQTGAILAQDADSSSGGSALGFLFPIVILGGLFYMLLIRPQRRRQRRMTEIHAAVEIGDEVRTVGGIYGRVTDIRDADIVIDVGGGTTLRIAARAIAERLGDPAE